VTGSSSSIASLTSPASPTSPNFGWFAGTNNVTATYSGDSIYAVRLLPSLRLT
jgi:hypothetical protein